MMKTLKLKICLVCFVIIVAHWAHSKEISPSYLIFFEAYESTISSEGRDIVQWAADEALRHPDYRVEVTGHDDSVLPELQSLLLSKERARETARLLIENGVLENRLVVKGVGFEDPLVPTGKGVSEPQNRRVSINFAPIAGKK